jgi:hypothetical protein
VAVGRQRRGKHISVATNILGLTDMWNKRSIETKNKGVNYIECVGSAVCYNKQC